MNNLEIQSKVYPKTYNSNFQFVKELGTGSYGTVALYSNGNEQRAIKWFDQRFCQSHVQESVNLRKIYEAQKSSQEFLTNFVTPKYYKHGNVKEDGKQYLYIEMEFIEDSILDYYEQLQRESTDKYLIRFCREMFEAVMKFHKTNYVHVDIKPENFRVQNKKIYLIDFGSSKQFITSEGSHIQYRENLSFRGTPVFASIYAAKGFESSRRDDLISTAYSILWIINQKLPWISQYIIHLDDKTIKEIEIMKSKLSESDFQTSYERLLVRIIKYLESLNFEDNAEKLEDYLQELESLFDPVHQVNFNLDQIVIEKTIKNDFGVHVDIIQQVDQSVQTHDEQEKIPDELEILEKVEIALQDQESQTELIDNKLEIQNLGDNELKITKLKKSVQTQFHQEEEKQPLRIDQSTQDYLMLDKYISNPQDKEFNSTNFDEKDKLQAYIHPILRSFFSVMNDQNQKTDTILKKLDNRDQLISQQSI
ncbi:cg2577-pa [Stylonychia lemnae]|uniref:Casein kinase I n=1 Tax=Stylonychia lemnae TaxID=5949 RepID=A0A077ZQR1_STYLE|nr:cg2577-pa [Stylonychia lemnae]|eukprot:CDW72263.1 cg2577-pa [Stylonychia lemnae]